MIDSSKINKKLFKGNIYTNTSTKLKKNKSLY